MIKIVFAPNDVLSKTAKPVEKIDSFVQKIIREMKSALLAAKDPEGVGLAAPQIGESLRIFIAKPKDKILVFINPEIIEIDPSTSKFTRGQTMKSRGAGSGSARKKGQKLEGCLSLKDIWGTVLRSPRVKLSYLDEHGKKQTKEFRDFMATIVQHEYDHLNGVLFPKRVLEQKGKLYKSSKDEKGEDVFEEIEI